jgi:hypothetical protein
LYFADREKGERKMNKKAFSMIVMLLASALIIGIQPNSTKAVVLGTTISILPSSLTFSNPAVNTQFDVNCTIANIHDFFGGDIQIGWNTTYIKYVSKVCTVPVEDWNATPHTVYYPHGVLYQNSSSAVISIVKNVVNEADHGFGGSAMGTMYWWAVASVAPVPSFNGTGTAFTMKFKIVYDASAHVGEPDVHTSIHFTSVTLGYLNGSSIPVTAYDANITIKNPSVILPPRPMLKVSPTDVYGVYNNLFDVSILLMNENHGDLSPFWDVAGFDFMLQYNASLIKAVSATADPDNWFNETYNGSMIYVVKQDVFDSVGWIVFLGIPNEYGNHTAVHGQGRIAKVTFNATYLQIPPPFIGPTCPLSLVNVTIAGYPHPERPYAPWNGSDSAVPLPYVVESATYHAPVLFSTGIDIYTQYAVGFGKGINMPTDMLWPQKGFTVYAYVLYNLWPEQQKDVAFELIDPYGTIRGIFYNRTDSTGHCWVFIRFPWPCTDPEYQFGYDKNHLPTPWTIIATVDIACKVYNDTMPFKYDYRVRIWKTTLDKATYNHGDIITITINYGTVSMQTFSVIFTATATDVTGVPFGVTWNGVQLGGAPWCTMKNGTLVLTIGIPKFARAGFPATVYVGVLSDWPQNGGDAYYPTRAPETIQQFSIYPY